MHSLIFLILLIAIAGASPVIADTGSHSGVLLSQQQLVNEPVNAIAIATFIIFVFFTLLITWWAARKTKDRDSFFVAGGNITPLQNGLAIAGDFMSAATFLGITGLMFMTGYDAYILGFSIMIGWPIMLMIVAERFRNLGRFTFVDVILFRLQGKSIRLLAAFMSLAVIAFYLIGQMVGAGKMIQLLFGFDYIVALIIISTLMIAYVVFGGMLATTWVQIIKAVLLLLGGSFLTILLLSEFGFDLEAMFAASASQHPRENMVFAPGGWLKGDLLNVATVGMTLCFGILGLPHILIRFFTVKNSKDARNSVAYATLVMGFFYLLILMIGFGSVAIIWENPEYYNTAGELIGGENMVALHMSKYLGGDFLLGFMSAVTFATILAVVVGLTLTGAVSVAHDIYATVIHDGKISPEKELKVSRITSFVIGVGALLLGIAFENQNIAVVVGIALALAASINFPLLLLSLYWKRFTSRGAVLGGVITFAVALILITLGDSVWVQLLGFERAIFPYVYPTIFTMPLAFALMWLFSISDRSDTGQLERTAFHLQFIRSETGIGASRISKH